VAAGLALFAALEKLQGEDGLLAQVVLGIGFRGLELQAQVVLGLGFRVSGFRAPGAPGAG